MMKLDWLLTHTLNIRSKLNAKKPDQSHFFNSIHNHRPTDIRKGLMMFLPSNNKTKGKLTTYLALKAVLHPEQNMRKSLVVGWRNETKSSTRTVDVTDLANSHEAADRT